MVDSGVGGCVGGGGRKPMDRHERREQGDEATEQPTRQTEKAIAPPECITQKKKKETRTKSTCAQHNAAFSAEDDG